MGLEPGYRWYSVDIGGQPRDGFFVDHEDHIFFWPSRKPPGYVVDPETAAKIKSLRMAGQRTQKVLALIGLLFLFFLRFVYRDPALHEQFHVITHNVSLVPAVFLGIAVALNLGTAWVAVERQMRLPRIMRLMRDCPTVNSPRPPLQFLKPASRGRFKAYAESKLRVVVGWVFVCLALLGGTIAGLTSELPWDPVVTVIAIPLLAWLWIGVRKVMRKGLARDEVEASAYLKPRRASA